MLTVEWDNLDQAIEDLIEKELTPIARGVINDFWIKVLYRTPQYYGRMVASWNYSIGAPQFVNRADVWGERDIPVSAGDMEAISYAAWMNQGKDSAFKLGDVVYMTNAADHGEGAYSQFIEDNAWYLRNVNMPGHAVERAMDATSALYGSGIPPQAVAYLKSIRITDV